MFSEPSVQASPSGSKEVKADSALPLQGPPCTPQRRGLCDPTSQTYESPVLLVFSVKVEQPDIQRYLRSLVVGMCCL